MISYRFECKFSRHKPLPSTVKRKASARLAGIGRMVRRRRGAYLLLLAVLWAFWQSCIPREPPASRARAESRQASSPLLAAVRLVERGDCGEALGEIDKIMRKNRRPRLLRRAEFLKGYCLLRLEKWAEAVRSFEGLVPSYPLLGDYVHYYLGRSHEGAGEPERALESYRKIRDPARAFPLGRQVLYRLAFLSFDDGDYPGAIDASIDWILGSAGEGRGRKAGSKVPEMTLLLAHALRAAGSVETAADFYKSIWTDFPSAPEAAAAVDCLEAMVVTGEISPWTPRIREVLHRARSFLLARRSKEALKLLEEIDETGPKRGNAPLPADLAAEAALLRIEALLLTGRSGEAMKLANRTAERYPERAGDYLGLLARKLVRRDRIAEAIKTYMKIADRFPSSNRAAESLYTAARLRQISARGSQAVATYRRLLKGYPESRWVPEALWHVGWIDYRSGRPESALVSWEKIVQGGREHPARPRALYWSARVLGGLGKAEKAASLLASLAEEDRGGYYGALARWRLLQLGRAAPPFSDERPKLLGAAAFEGRRITEKTLGEILSPLAGETGQTLRRGAELLLMGMKGEAAGEFETVILKEVPLPFVAVAFRLLMEAGEYHKVELLGLKLFGEKLKKLDSETAWYWQFAYPRAYTPLVKAASGRFGVPPSLVYAVMREESAFQPEVVSWADAHGLMQIIPPTAKKIAAALDVSPFVVEDLHRPELNVTFGAWYLSSLLERFGGRFVYAVASYNGGPHNVEAWRGRFDEPEPDEFAELIPFSETRRYVRKVLKSYSVYDMLYGDGSAPPPVFFAPPEIAFTKPGGGDILHENF